MSSIQHEDSRCYVCQAHAPTRCDSCKRYVCSTHSRKIDLNLNVRKYIFCEECAKKKEKNKTNHTTPQEMW